MNYLSSREVCAVMKVIGCISAIPLIILTLWIPYMSVVVASALTVILLWLNRSELPVNYFQSTLVGLTAGVVPIACALSYTIFRAVKNNDGFIGVTTSNILSMSIGLMIFVFLINIVFTTKDMMGNKSFGSQTMLIVFIISGVLSLFSMFGGIIFEERFSYSFYANTLIIMVFPISLLSVAFAIISIRLDNKKSDVSVTNYQI